MLDNVWEHLLPGFTSTRPDGGAQQDLDQRLRGLRLPPCLAHPSPPRWEDWIDGTFPVASAAEGPSAAPLASVELRRTDRQLQVTIADAANRLTFPFGATDWLLSVPRDVFGDAVPVAASGGWLEDHTLRVEVIFLESPHRMDIVCSLSPRTAEAAWRHPPLAGGRLRTMHSPRSR